MRFISRLSRSPWGIGLVFALACAVRIGMASTFVGLNTPPDEGAGGLDVVDYEGFARRVANGDGYSLSDGAPTARRSPGTSFTILPMYVLFGHSYLAAHLWFILISALTCAATVWLAREITEPEPALVAGLWLALYPGHAYSAMHFFSEVPYALAMVLGSLATYRSFTRDCRWCIVGAGVAWGAAALIRPQVLLLLPVAAGMFLLFQRCRTMASARRMVLIASVAGLVIAPWVIRNARVMGKPAIATLVGGYTFWGANNETVLRDPTQRGYWVFGQDLTDADHPLAGSEVEREAQAWRYGTEFVRSHLRDMPALVAARIQRFVTPFESTANRPVYYSFALSWLLTVPFVLYGMVRVYRSNRVGALVLVAPILATLGTVMLFYGSIRFRDSLLPLLLVFAASGFAAAASAVGLPLSRAVTSKAGEQARETRGSDARGSSTTAPSPRRSPSL